MKLEANVVLPNVHGTTRYIAPFSLLKIRYLVSFYVQLKERNKTLENDTCSENGQH